MVRDSAQAAIQPFICACVDSPNSSSYHIRGNEMNCLGSSEYLAVDVIYSCQFP